MIYQQPSETLFDTCFCVRKLNNLYEKKNEIMVLAVQNDQEVMNFKH